MDAEQRGDLLRLQHYQQLSSEVMSILDEPMDFKEAVHRILAAIKQATQVDAVAIRLRQENDFPYFAQNGFSAEFLLAENSLTVQDAEVGACRGEDSDSRLECTCGLVLEGRTVPGNPLFTDGGSAWANDAAILLDIPPEQDPRLHPRNRCVHAGYSSVALVPIRANGKVVGLLQLNDRKKNRFSQAIVRVFEGIGASIGAALRRNDMENALRANEARYRAVMEHSFEALAIIDIDTQEVIEVNRRFSELFGYSLPQDAPLYVHQFVVESREKLDEIYKKLRSMMVLHTETRIFRHKNGTMVPVERAGSVITVNERQFYLASMRDMTAERRRQTELQRDIELACRVQRELLPKLAKSPWISLQSIFHPANLVSGDFYQLEWKNNGTLLRCFLIDAAGHGVATAIQLSSLTVLLREAGNMPLSLLEQMQWVNRHAAHYFAEGAYAAMLGFELDLAKRELRYVGAGITQFYHNGKRIATPGMFVGLWQDAEFIANAMAVKQGDVFCFLTDGFTDVLAQTEHDGCRPVGGKDFDAAVAALEQMAESGGLRDDATGICLRIDKIPRQLKEKHFE